MSFFVVECVINISFIILPMISIYNLETEGNMYQLIHEIDLIKSVNIMGQKYISKSEIYR